MPIKTSREVSVNLWHRLEERLKDPRKVWGIPWAFPGLNELTGGIHAGEMTILTARPGVGKTSVMVQQALCCNGYLATEEGRSKYHDAVVKLVLCESTPEVFQRRLVCAMANVPSKKLQTGIGLSTDEVARVREAITVLAKLRIEYLYDPESLDDIARFVSDGRPTLWWALDHIHKCPLTAGRANDHSVGSLTIIGNTLASLATTVAPGLVLAHTPRDVDKREDRRPMMGDIKGASTLEGNARVVLGLYREDIYLHLPDEQRNQPKIAELLLLKQNEGESNYSIGMLWHPNKSEFEDVSSIFKEYD